MYSVFVFQKIQDVFDKYDSYSENRKMVMLHEFANFLITEQKDNIGKDQRKVSLFMCDFLKVGILVIICIKIYQVQCTAGPTT